MPSPEENIKASVEYDTDTADVTVTLALRSIKKPMLWARQTCRINDANLTKFSQYAGGALAEYLGVKYGDNYTPERCAQLGWECIVEALEKAKK